VAEKGLANPFTRISLYNYMLRYIIIFGFWILSNGATFLLDNEGWTIVGNKRVELAKHQSYSLGPKMSHYILGTDDLVNVDLKNRDDKILWYFRSPPIYLVKRPVLMVFTIMSFSGDFSKLNAGVPLVKILGTDNLSVVFYKLRIEMVGGFMETVNVPLITDEFAKIFQKPFVGHRQCRVLLLEKRIFSLQKLK
jgi:hypothetical protein